MDGNRKLHQVKLEDLQLYFEHNIFYFEGCEDSEDYHEALERQYEAQVTDFLRSIGAMVSVDTFTAISGDAVVYVRKVPPGLKQRHRNLRRNLWP